NSLTTMRARNASSSRARDGRRNLLWSGAPDSGRSRSRTPTRCTGRQAPRSLTWEAALRAQRDNCRREFGNGDDQSEAALPHAFGPMAGFGEGFAGFEEALEVGEDVRPPVRHHADQLRVGLVDFVNDGEFDRFPHRFEFVGETGIAFGMGFRKELVAPRKD